MLAACPRSCAKRQDFNRQQSDIRGDVEKNVHTPGWKRAATDAQENIEAAADTATKLSDKLFESFNAKYNSNWGNKD